MEYKYLIINGKIMKFWDNYILFVDNNFLCENELFMVINIGI